MQEALQHVAAQQEFLSSHPDNGAEVPSRTPHQRAEARSRWQLDIRRCQGAYPLAQARELGERLGPGLHELVAPGQLRQVDRRVLAAHVASGDAAHVTPHAG